MKSTTRMLGGFQATRTRRLNQLRQRAWNKLCEISREETGFYPNILPITEGGVELSFDMGYGFREIKFKTREEARDYVLSLFCCH